MIVKVVSLKEVKSIHEKGLERPRIVETWKETRKPWNSNRINTWTISHDKLFYIFHHQLCIQRGFMRETFVVT